MVSPNSLCSEELFLISVQNARKDLYLETIKIIHMNNHSSLVKNKSNCICLYSVRIQLLDCKMEIELCDALVGVRYIF